MKTQVNGYWVVPDFNGKSGRSFTSHISAESYCNRVHGLGFCGIIEWYPLLPDQKGETKQVACDKCGKPNDNAAWSNFCSACRDAFHSHAEQERNRDKRNAEQFWANKPYGT